MQSTDTPETIPAAASVAVLVERPSGYPRGDVTHWPGTVLEIPRPALAGFLAHYGREATAEDAPGAPKSDSGDTVAAPEPDATSTGQEDAPAALPEPTPDPAPVAPRRRGRRTPPASS